MKVIFSRSITLWVNFSSLDWVLNVRVYFDFSSFSFFDCVKTIIIFIWECQSIVQNIKLYGVECLCDLKVQYLNVMLKYTFVLRFLCFPDCYVSKTNEICYIVLYFNRSLNYEMAGFANFFFKLLNTFF